MSIAIHCILPAASIYLKVNVLLLQDSVLHHWLGLVRYSLLSNVTHQQYNLSSCSDVRLSICTTDNSVMQ